MARYPPPNRVLVAKGRAAPKVLAVRSYVERGLLVEWTDEPPPFRTEFTLTFSLSEAAELRMSATVVYAGDAIVGLEVQGAGPDITACLESWSAGLSAEYRSQRPPADARPHSTRSETTGATPSKPLDGGFATGAERRAVPSAGATVRRIATPRFWGSPQPSERSPAPERALGAGGEQRALPGHAGARREAVGSTPTDPRADGVASESRASTHASSAPNASISSQSEAGAHRPGLRSSGGHSTRAALAPEPVATSGQPSASSEPPSVLIVEDDPAIAVMLQVALRKSGIEALMARDVDAARTILGRRRFSVMLLDWMLPRTSGDVLLAESRRLYPDMPVAVLSGVVSQRSTREAIRSSGAAGVFAKPFSVVEVIRWVKAHLGNEGRSSRGRQVTGRVLSVR